MLCLWCTHISCGGAEFLEAATDASHQLAVSLKPAVLHKLVLAQGRQCGRTRAFEVLEFFVPSPIRSPVIAATTDELSPRHFSSLVMT